MEGGVGRSGRPVENASGASEPSKRQQSGKKDGSQITAVDIEPQTLTTHSAKNHGSPQNISLSQREVAVHDSAQKPMADISFCEFQLKVATLLAEDRSLDDDLVVYWQGNDGTTVDVDPPDSNCTDELYHHYEVAKDTLRRHSDRIIATCQKQYDEACKTSPYPTPSSERMNTQSQVSFSNLFTMIHTDGSQPALGLMPDDQEASQDFVCKRITEVRHLEKTQAPAIRARATVSPSHGFIEKVLPQNRLPENEREVEDKHQNDSPEWTQEKSEKKLNQAKKQSLTETPLIVPDNSPNNRFDTFKATIFTPAQQVKWTKQGFENEALYWGETRLGTVVGEEDSPVLIGQEGAYIPLQEGEPVQGFDGAFYLLKDKKNWSVAKDRCAEYQAGDQVVVFDGHMVTIPAGQDERLITLGKQTCIVSREGEVRLIAEGQHVVPGFADKAYVGSHNTEFHRVPVEMDQPLLRSIRWLDQGLPHDSRAALQSFYNSPLAAILSGREERSRNGLDTDEPLLDAEFIKPFIQSYKKAVLLEKKPGKETSGQSIKKARRIEAIEQVEQFVNALDQRSANYKAACQLACQMLLRIREPGFVLQVETPRCGGFALLQYLWRTQPEKMTHHAIELYTRKNTQVIAQNGDPLTLTLPENLNTLPFSGEDAVDKLLIHGLYKQDFATSSVFDDTYRANFFDLHGQLYHSPVLPKDKVDQEALLHELAQCSKRKCGINLGFTSQFSDVLRSDLDKHQVSGKSKTVYQLPKRTNSKPERVGHSVMVDAFSYDQGVIEMKLHSWGKTRRYRLGREEFFHYLMSRPAVYMNTLTQSESSLFKPVADENIILTQKGPAYINCHGVKQLLSPYKICRGLDNTQYFCDDRQQVFSEPEHKQLQRRPDGTLLPSVRR